jgi:heme A synthase
MDAPTPTPLNLTHFQSMCLFAFVISLAFAFMSRKRMGERLRYTLYAFLAFLLVAVAMGWLMFPASH